MPADAPASHLGSASIDRAKIPGIDDRSARVGEIGDIAGGNRGAPRDGNGGNLRVELADRPTDGPAMGSNRRLALGRVAIEGENPTGEILGENRPDRRLERLAPATVWKERQSIENFRLSHGRGENRGGGLRGEPGDNRQGR